MQEMEAVFKKRDTFLKKVSLIKTSFRMKLRRSLPKETQNKWPRRTYEE
jgi:hypothetical protein